MRHPLPFLLGAVEISTTHSLPSLIWLLVFVNNSETPVFFSRAEGTQDVMERGSYKKKKKASFGAASGPKSVS